MQTNQTDNGMHYSIWAADNVVYGPVELPTLISWVKDERVTSDTWVFDGQNERWRKAANLAELALFFRKRPPGVIETATSADRAAITPGMLRRVKALADLSDEQLEHFIEFMEPQITRQWTEIVKQGAIDDSMFLVLDGELRVRLMIGGKETILATLGPGECFGEIALFDQGPRSADVLANKDSILLKVSSEAFDKLRREAPELCAPILFAISKTLAARIRADNKRIKDSVTFARAAAPK
ncbi:MAG TPA: cyclic nucleotide-binding domain-containing protein [Verrucomicrobiae bacterium]|jgi:CRP-like cAMP-binding protein|nr:cyclic nucleotide-binding domain-containing protein [Verrucomicrobiae bacterium]